MPGRKIPLITGEVYHVFNRGIDRRTTFTETREYQRALSLLTFYQCLQVCRFSRFAEFSQERQHEVVIEDEKNRLVECLCFCLMPNHFHLMIKQVKDDGISKFMSNFQNSYTRYFNVRNKRIGSLFLDQFKAVRIETDEQLVHISRYIHLNPYTSYLVRSEKELMDYPWSSLGDYLYSKKSSVIKSKFILDMFKNKEEYKEFVMNQADYQRELKTIEHLLLESTP